MIDACIFLIAVLSFFLVRRCRGDSSRDVLPNWSHADAATKELLNLRFSKNDFQPGAIEKNGDPADASLNPNLASDLAADQNVS